MDESVQIGLYSEPYEVTVPNELMGKHMNIETKVHHITYSEVLYNRWYYRVYPDGSVCKWDLDDGYWHDMSPVDDGYDEVEKAGLDALKRAGFVV